MARQVLPWVGAAAGFAVGGVTGAQIGFAAGSYIGGIVDPIEMQGRKLGDAPTQVAAEGGARAIVFGKGCIRGTCILERGGRRVIKQRDSSGGKGSGPTTVNQRALWTFAIGLGEAIPGGAVLRIWEQEKLVYDVTPGSTIQEESAAFAEKFRFYDGSDTQLPDPAIEAIYDDPEDAPYYRGTAYLVFPQYDTTDFGEAVPQYRVEVATLTDHISVTRALAFGLTGASTPRSVSSESGDSWPGTTDARPVNTAEYLAASGTRHFAWNITTLYYTDTGGPPWTTATGGLGGSGGVRDGDAVGDLLLIAGGANGVYRSTDHGENIAEIAGSANVGYLKIGNSITVGVNVSSGNAYVAGPDGSAWTGPYPTGVVVSSGQCALATDRTRFYLGGRSDAIGGHPVLKMTMNGSTWTELSLPYVTAEQVRCIACGTIAGDRIVVVGTDNGEIYYRVNDGPFLLASDSLGAQCNSVQFNGEIFIMGGGSSDDGVIKTSGDGDEWEPETQPLAYVVSRLACADPSLPQQLADPITLSSVIADIHERCGHSSGDYDVSEATDLIAGVTIEQTVTGAEAINSIIGGYLLGPSDYDGQIHYIKFGKPVVKTLTVDDLIDEPETNQRKNAIEYPLKVHFFYQGSAEAYASPKATSSRYSKDLKNVGEISVSSPVTFDDGQEPAEIVAKLHKALWARAEGEIVWPVTDEHLDLVATDAVGLVYRGQVMRAMITQIEDEPGQRKLRMLRDRQSAYTANITEIPVPPPPTPPQPSIPSQTILAVMDLPALTDDVVSLNIYAAMSGATDNWAGSVLQQSLDGGASFSTIDSTTVNAIMGTLIEDVAAASPYYTDTTNEVVVQLFTDDTLESISESEFLSQGNPFAVSYEDSGVIRWELLQFRDAVEIAPKTYRLTHLQRGRKNTEGAAHPTGSRFVLIDPTVLRESAQSAWLNTDLTYRAVSNGQSPEAAPIQTNLYVGNSQLEWPVANLLLERDGDDIIATAIPRHRFGTEIAPVRSVNWTAYRWVVTDGTNTINRDGTADTETFDTTGWGTPIDVSVAQVNLLTGAGPTVTEEIA